MFWCGEDLLLLSVKHSYQSSRLDSFFYWGTNRLHLTLSSRGDWLNCSNIIICLLPIKEIKIKNMVLFTIPAIMLSVVDIRWRTCWISPTSVHACRLRRLFLRMAVKMLHTSAWQVGSHLSNSSTMHTMLSGSWMMKFISRSNWPPTSWDTKGEKECAQNQLATEEISHLKNLKLQKIIFNHKQNATSKHSH